MTKRDYYDILGISRSASEQEIKRAFRQKAMKYHPDVNKEPEAEKWFKEINEAYEVLSNSEKKQIYDQFGHEGLQGHGATPGGFSGFSFDDLSSFNFGSINDMLNEVFGHMDQAGAFGGFRSNQRGNTQQKNVKKRGVDLILEENITFKESYDGVVKKIVITIDEKCVTCDGKGYENDADISICSQCNGQGQIKATKQTMFGTIQQVSTCPLCYGSGKQVTKKCSSCKGKTVNRVKKTLEIKFPPGIADGDRMQLAGKGPSGLNGGPNGDIYVNVKVEQDDYFSREDDNLLLEIKVSIFDLLKGRVITIFTPKEEFQKEIPPLTSPGSRLRIKNKGFRNIRTGIYGDLLLKLKTIMPRKLSKSEQKLVMQLQAEARDSVNEEFEKELRKYYNKKMS